ncbi:2082_t:CDS:2 [Ambispora gerdemannii]|uniref:2082_t:CDS:1 n=1 Tax=Ambispora gerdemannii TaxID=144530 RepID=A0A9N9FLX5_9GLOM|nr:2082_t:CDS:2 [Ambispora gerdemannii]
MRPMPKELRLCILVSKIRKHLSKPLQRKTNQTNTALNTPVPPTVDAIRSACASMSAITGNASGYDAANSANGGMCGPGGGGNNGILLFITKGVY